MMLVTSANPSRTSLRLICVDCKHGVDETWDDRCGECFYVYTGGDLGEDDWWSKHAVINNGAIHWEIK